VGDPRHPAVRAQLGVAPQVLALYEMLTGEENLHFFGEVYGLSGTRLTERVRWSLDFVGLTDRARDFVNTYSGGMKRRMNLASALVHDPQLVLLDEPTVGVDPQSRNQIFENILALKQLGRTLIYTTHYMEEAERLCDRVAIIEHGRIIDVDTPGELVRRHCPERTIVLATDHPAAEDAFRRIARVQSVTRASGYVTIAGHGDELVMDVINCLSETQLKVTDFRTVTPSLEDVFLKLTGHSIRD